MNTKKTQARIRGWFPSTPTLPQEKNGIGKMGLNKTTANPLPPPMESKFQRGVGILIGFGIGLTALGFGAALTTNMAYNEALKVLSNLGIIAESYLFRNLLDQTAFYLAVGVMGVFVIVLGAVSLRTQIFRQASIYKEKHFFGNFAFGFGIGLILFGLRYLFLFLLIPDAATPTHDFRLATFAAFFVVGVVLFASGILSGGKRSEHIKENAKSNSRLATPRT